MTSPGNINFSWDALSQTAAINGRLLMNGIVGPFFSPINAGIIYYDATTNRFKASENGAAPVNVLTGGGGGSAYTNIAVNGVAQAQESVLNIVGTPFTGTDVPGVQTNVTMHVADTSHDGYLSSTDWNTFSTSAMSSVPSTRNI